MVNRYARDFIASHKDGPFLLYYPMILTHAPFQPTPDSKDWDPRTADEKAKQAPKHFGDMVAYTDKLIGKLVAALEENGVRDNTLLIVVGDNGTTRGVRSKLGQRVIVGAKGASTHAGTHVPLVASWPGVIPPGLVIDDLIDSTDFLPTICQAAGVEIPSDLVVDGHSFLAQLSGEKGNPRPWIYCWYARNGGRRPDFEFAMNHRFKLYGDGRIFDLAADLDERQPLDTASLSDDARAARGELSRALAQYADARPAEIAAQQKLPGAKRKKAGAASGAN